MMTTAAGESHRGTGSGLQVGSLFSKPGMAARLRTVIPLKADSPVLSA